VFKIGVCEMCGSENRLYKAEIEGTIMTVCEHCAKFGKIVANVQDKRYIEKMQKKREEHKRVPLISEKEMIEGLVENFHEIIKKGRESLNLTQEEFAKKINEKESLLHKIETGNFEPNILLAKKIERFLKVRLIEQKEGEIETAEKTKTEAFTLGDFIKIRKR
jgi:putative transcription factor